MTKRVRMFENGKWINRIEFDEAEDMIIREGWYDAKISWKDLSTSIGVSPFTIKRRGMELGLGDFVASNAWHQEPGEKKTKKEVQNPHIVPEDIEDEIRSYFKAMDMEYDNPPRGKNGNVMSQGNFPMPKGYVRSSGMKRDCMRLIADGYNIYEIINGLGNFECVVKVPALKYNPEWSDIVNKEKEIKHLYALECRALSMVSYLQFIEWKAVNSKGETILTRTPKDYFHSEQALFKQKTDFYVWKIRTGDTLRNHGRKQMSALIYAYKRWKGKHQKDLWYKNLEDELKDAKSKTTEQ